MEEIFIIQENYSDFELGSSDVGFVLTEIEAKSQVKELTEKYLARVKFTNDFYKKVHEFQLANFPTIENMLETPTHSLDLRKSETTSKILREQDSIKKINEMRTFRNSQKEDEYNKKLYEYSLPLYNSAPEEMKKHFIIIKLKNPYIIEMDDCSLAHRDPYSFKVIKKIKTEK